MQDVGDKQRVVKKSSGGPNYGILFFVAAGVIVLAVGVFFLFGWIGDTLNGDGGSSGDAGAGSGDVGGGDSGTGNAANLDFLKDYARCDSLTDGLVYVRCMVPIAVLKGEEICSNDAVEWRETPTASGGLVNIEDYCWLVMSGETNDKSYCGNIVASSSREVCLEVDI